jgi:hypothetical protein
MKCSISLLLHSEWVCIETHREGRTYSAHNPVQPRQIMRIIEKIMRIIVQEHSIRQLSTLSVRLPVDADEKAFFFNTNRSFLHDWFENCCLHIPIFRVQTP